MKIAKPALISLLTLLLLIGWGVGLYVLFEEQASPLMMAAVIVPALIAGVIIYLQHGILPSKQLYDIASLAEKIEAHVNDSSFRIA